MQNDTLVKTYSMLLKSNLRPYYEKDEKRTTLILAIKEPLGSNRFSF